MNLNEYHNYIGIYNVKDFGAVGDGVADDSQAITEAMTAAGNGGTVTFPPGTYMATNLNTGAANMRFVGSYWSQNSTVIKNNAGDTTPLWTVDNSRCTFEYISFDGGAAQVSPRGDQHIMVLSENDSWGTTIEKCFFYNCGGHALMNTVASPPQLLTTLTVRDTTFQGGDLGFVNLQHCAGHHFYNCVFQRGGVTAGLPYAIQFAEAEPLAASDARLIDCYFEFIGTTEVGDIYGPGDSNIVTDVIVNARGVDVRGNRFAGSGTMPEQDSVVQIGGQARYCTFTQNSYGSKDSGAVDIEILSGARYNKIWDERGVTDAQTPISVTDNSGQYNDIRLWHESGDTYNVKDYGATGDGTTDDTAEINAAISAANTAGGGTVYIPGGGLTYYISSSLDLLGDVTLHIARGATILSDQDIDMILIKQRCRVEGAGLIYNSNASWSKSAVYVNPGAGNQMNREDGPVGISGGLMIRGPSYEVSSWPTTGCAALRIEITDSDPGITNVQWASFRDFNIGGTQYGIHLNCAGSGGVKYINSNIFQDIGIEWVQQFIRIESASGGDTGNAVNRNIFRGISCQTTDTEKANERVIYCESDENIFEIISWDFADSYEAATAVEFTDTATANYLLSHIPPHQVLQKTVAANYIHSINSWGSRGNNDQKMLTSVDSWYKGNPGANAGNIAAYAEERGWTVSVSGGVGVGDIYDAFRPPAPVSNAYTVNQTHQQSGDTVIEITPDISTGYIYGLGMNFRASRSAFAIKLEIDIGAGYVDWMDSRCNYQADFFAAHKWALEGPVTKIRITLNRYWHAARAYQKGDICEYNSVLYHCIADSTNNAPPNATYWEVTTGAVTASMAIHRIYITGPHDDKYGHYWLDRAGAAGGMLANLPLVSKTTAELASTSDLVNTTNKTEGALAYNETTKEVVVASGSADDAPWAGNGVYNVKAFGAVGDGVTDDTAAIQAALDAAALGTSTYAAASIDHSAIVFFPPSNSNYIVKGSLHVRQQGLILRGSGKYGSNIKFEPDGTAWTDPDGQVPCINIQKSVGYIGGVGANYYASGTTTSGGSPTVLTDTGATFTDGTDEITVGCMVINETTGAWGEVTFVTDTALVHTALTGGSSTVWGSGDAYHAGGPLQHRYTRIEDLHITTTDTTTDKVGIRVVDGAQLTLDNVFVNDFQGADSTGIRIFGREFIHLRNVRCDATIPFRISRIKDAGLNGANSCDYLLIESAEFSALNMSAPTGAFPYTAMLIDGDAQLIRCNFRNINFRGGNYAVHWNNPAGQTDQGQSHNVRFENCHWEQTAISPVATFYFNFDASALQNLHMSNCLLRVKDFTNTNNCVGLYLKAVHNVTLDGMGVRTTGGGYALNVGSGVQTLKWDGMNSTSGNTYNISATSLDRVYAYYSDSNDLPKSALYIQNWRVNANTGGTTTVLATENGKIFQNVGTVTAETFNLPTAAAAPQELTFQFNKANDYQFRIVPQAGNYINTGGAGKYIEITSARGSVTLQSVTSTRWLIIAQSGTIVYEA